MALNTDCPCTSEPGLQIKIVCPRFVVTHHLDWNHLSHYKRRLIRWKYRSTVHFDQCVAWFDSSALRDPAWENILKSHRFDPSDGMSTARKLALIELRGVILLSGPSKHPRQHLSNFSGILQADGYAGFHHLYGGGRIVESACWAHLRRKFYDMQA